MRDDALERAKQFAAMSPEELGRSEEEVKINFVVPLLEIPHPPHDLRRRRGCRIPITGKHGPTIQRLYRGT